MVTKVTDDGREKPADCRELNRQSAGRIGWRKKAAGGRRAAGADRRLWGLYALPLFMPVADVLTFVAVAIVLYQTKKSLEKLYPADLDTKSVG